MKAIRFIVFPLLLVTFVSVRAIGSDETRFPLPSGNPADLPDAPADELIEAVRAFPGSFLPAGKTTPAENAAFTAALKACVARPGTPDVSKLAEFVSDNPDSPWALTAIQNLAEIYYSEGYFSKALDAWEQGWELGKTCDDPKMKPVVDAILGELAKMNARLGRVERLEELRKETSGRQVTGAATEMLTGAWEGLWIMKNQPEKAFLCGPSAVANISALYTANGRPDSRMADANSGRDGTTLTQVSQWAKGIGLKFQMAFRESGAPVIVPAVVNWKVGHFAALTKKVEDGYLMRDPTFGGGDFVMSKEALDAEASGYFLVPEGKLPEGWRTVANAEGDKVFGKGTTSGTDTEVTRPCDSKTSPCGGTPMAMAAGHLAAVSLNIADTPLYYTPPVGPPIRFTVTYNQRDAVQNLWFTPPLGQKWTNNYLSYVWESGSNTGDYRQVYVSGGGGETYNYNSTTGDYGPSYFSQSTLKRYSWNHYELIFPDGTIEKFEMPQYSEPGAQKIFLTQIVDPHGNAITINYIIPGIISSITDAVGQVTTFSYENPSNSYLVTKITDPFGRSAKFDYAYENNAWRLKKITDMIGITSEFTYSGDFIQTMTTPYGSSSFAYGDATTDSNLASRTRWLELTDPRGGKERVEFNELSNIGIQSSLPSNELPANMYNRNTFMYARNTYYWNKKAMAVAPGDYSAAYVYHWLHHNGLSQSSGILESEKPPLEARIWYNYPGQAVYPGYGSPQFDSSVTEEGTSRQPSIIGRVLDTSTGLTQTYKRDYNGQGYVTKEIDPLGRTTFYEYASNGIDLLAVYQLNSTGSTTYNYNGTNYTVDKIASFAGYNSYHQPGSYTDAAGQTTSFTYNSQGQILTRKVYRNGQYETTTWNYTNNYLMSITGPVAGAAKSFTYDSHGRVRTVSDSEGYTLTYDYDDLDRITKVTYPDGTYTQTLYDRLDPAWERDRMGRWTHSTYDALRHLHTVTDPEGRTTTYDWCICGALDKIYDGNNNLTKFERDVETRVTKKIYADSSEENYVYEPRTSRLHTFQDAKSWTRTYTYDLANAPLQVTYSHPSLSSPTQSYAYSPVYPRLVSATRGTNTTTFTYYPVTQPSGTLGANQIWKVDGPLSGTTDELAYTYDELGQVLSAKINGTGETVSYDALGRVTSAVNPLGTFAYTYLNQTPRVDTVTRSGGQFAVDYGYYPNAQDQRLSEIKNMGPSSTVISKFNYGYDANGDITNWTQQQAGNPQLWTLGYDKARELRSATVRDTVSGGALNAFSYTYDAAGNRKTWQQGAAVSTGNYNNLNQLTSTSVGGSVVLRGSVNEPSTVTVNGIQVKVDTANQFQTTLNVNAGLNQFPITATDGSGNTTTKTASFTASGSTVSPTYDLNGNMTAYASKTCEWDAENRLIAVNYSGTGNRTEFDYDGLGRRIKIVEKTNNAVTSTKNLVWIGDRPAEERDASNTVTRRFFSQGEQIGSSTYFYGKDHLGSIREMTDTSGAIRARYTYDPYGVRTKISGDLDASFGFTGHYYHDRSGLVLSKYRPYIPELGRWGSRDPLRNAELIEGANVYDYVLNNPVNLWDPLGLIDWGPGTEEAKKEMEATTEGTNTIKRVEACERNAGETVSVVVEYLTNPHYDDQKNKVILTSTPPLVHVQGENGTTQTERATQGEVLNHELNHAADDLAGNLDKLAAQTDEQFDNKCERKAISSENRMRAEQGKKPRVDHWGGW